MKKKTLQILFWLCVVLPFFGVAQNPCSGTPGSNTIVPLTQTICAGTNANMTLLNSYSNTGITFQWQTSTVSIVGPYSTIPGATVHAYSSPTLNTTTFFNVIITCTNSGLSISIPYSVTVITCTNPCGGVPGA